ncbi:hypothetical protein AAF712_008870 [Marasmius tenuissimus]|uniref:Mitochondrial splicing suppressor 51-like C-terminal domain-containing protein n=1 Tax=Marasmius tenuissimus TaxID=585030 RepID=A0ABR2ZRW5_9AGAR
MRNAKRYLAVLLGHEGNVVWLIFLQLPQADWKAHKQICNAIASLGSDAGDKAELTGGLPRTASDDFQTVNETCQQNFQTELKLLQSHMKRNLTFEEQKILVWQPRCMGCSRTERLIRIEGADGKAIKPCDVCKATFCCCEEHWDIVRDKHVNEPVWDVPGNLSQCQINRQICGDILFANIMVDSHTHEPNGVSLVSQWRPERHLSKWEPLKTGDKCWEEEFNASLQKEVVASLGPVPPGSFLRSATQGLSMPMTILYALQQLKPLGRKEEFITRHGPRAERRFLGIWTGKQSLTIHLLGAREMEILHAPRNCIKDQKQCTFEVHAMSYHKYIEKQGARYTNPDLAVAFNFGASSYASSWAETMEVLVRKAVATVFTSQNRDEAEAESQLLRVAGASLVLVLGPVRNPWGGLQLLPEPNKVTGFYANNGCLAGGFCD